MERGEIIIWDLQQKKSKTKMTTEEEDNAGSLEEELVSSEEEEERPLPPRRAPVVLDKTPHLADYPGTEETWGMLTIRRDLDPAECKAICDMMVPRMVSETVAPAIARIYVQADRRVPPEIVASMPEGPPKKLKTDSRYFIGPHYRGQDPLRLFERHFYERTQTTLKKHMEPVFRLQSEFHEQEKGRKGQSKAKPKAPPQGAAKAPPQGVAMFDPQAAGRRRTRSSKKRKAVVSPPKRNKKPRNETVVSPEPRRTSDSSAAESGPPPALAAAGEGATDVGVVDDEAGSEDERKPAAKPRGWRLWV